MTHRSRPSFPPPLQPRIYVACLASYNRAILHGQWLEADDDPEHLREQIQQMLEDSPSPGAEEFAIHDYEGFGGLRLSEFDSLERIHQSACLIVEYRIIAQIALEHCGGVEFVDQAQRMLEDGYQGAYDSKEDWAFEFLEENGLWAQVPEHLQSYLDLERYAHDLELSGYTAHWASGQWYVSADG